MREQLRTFIREDELCLQKQQFRDSIMLVVKRQNLNLLQLVFALWKHYVQVGQPHLQTYIHTHTLIYIHMYSENIRDLRYRKQRDRVVAGRGQFGFGAGGETTVGGKAIAAALISFVRSILKGLEGPATVLSVWSAAYKENTGKQRFHTDKGKFIRFVSII